MPLIPHITSLKELRDVDEHYYNDDHALISLAMYGRAESPLYAAIWAPVKPFSDGDKVPVRKRTFEIDWTASTITAHGLEKRYPTLVGITAWEFEQPRSVLVFEQFSKSTTWPQVVTVEEPSRIAEDFQLYVVSGLDMCVQRFAKPSTTYPFVSYTSKQTYVAVLHYPPEKRTMFNVQRLESVKDKLDGLDSLGQHRAAMRGWSRGHHAIPFPKNVSGGRRQVAVHYQDDTFKKWPTTITEEFRCGTPIEGPIKPSQIHGRVDAGEAKGYWPLRVGANGWGEHARFFITWAKKGKLLPLKRYDIVVDGIEATDRRVMQGRGYQVGSGLAQATAVATGPASLVGGGEPAQNPGRLGGALGETAEDHLSQLDKLVFKSMHEQGAHTAQIAVAKDSKLKLVRSYTFAERNWPVTHAHHRMRMGSIAKLLMGMRASVETQTFLEDPIAGYLPDVLLGASDTVALAKVDEYAATRLIDLLRYQSGWGGNYYQSVLEAVQQLPLQAGDFGEFVKQSKLKFVDVPPASVEKYINFNFIAASEILAKRLTDDPALYIPLMQSYWSIGEEDLTDRIGPLPRTRELCLVRGEPPLRGIPGATRGTFSKKVATADGWPPPWVPASYKECADAEFAVGAGYFTLSAVMLARILQGMCPAPIEPVKLLMTREQRIRMLQTNAVSVAADSPDPGDYGVGASSLTTSFAGNAGTTKILKGGDVTHSAGRSEVAHYVWGPANAEHHLTVVTTITAIDPIEGIEAEVEELEELGYWDSDVNLFPGFFGT